MDSLVQLVAAVVSMTASFALVFGGIASWFLRRLDRRFDAIERQAREDKADIHRQFDGVQRQFDGVQRQFEEQRTDVQRQFDGVQRQFDALREEHGRLSTRLDAVGQRIDAVSDQLSDARQSLGRLEGAILRNLEPEALTAPRRS